MSGWFAIKHGIRKHPIFAGKPERLGAWVAILDEVAWADTRQNVGGKVITVKRGELCASQAMLEEITGLTRKQLRTFIDLLKAEGVVRTRPATKGAKSRAILTVCNYDKYQSAGPSGGQEGAKEGPRKEQDKQIPVGTDADAPADPAKIVFDSGVKILMAAGKSQGQARAMVGKWRKDHSDDALIAAFGRCQREGAVEPVSFITGALNFQTKQELRRKSHPEIGDYRDFGGVRKRYAGNGVGWVVEHA